MSKPKTGGPAIQATLRDYFAAEAMKVFLKLPVEDWPCDIERTDSHSAAAYEMADAMLKARKE